MIIIIYEEEKNIDMPSEKYLILPDCRAESDFRDDDDSDDDNDDEDDGDDGDGDEGESESESESDDWDWAPTSLPHSKPTGWSRRQCQVYHDQTTSHEK